MLIVSQVKQCVNTLNTIAFYKENNNYRLDDAGIDKAKQRFLTTASDATDDSQHDYGDYQNLITQVNNYFDKLDKIRIPITDFENYLNSHTHSQTIDKYLMMRKDAAYIFMPYLSLDSAYVGDSNSDAYYHDNQTVKKDNATILNHNNPFADVEIEDQAFLFADTNGKYHTLAFNVGNTLTKIENANGVSLALKPNFKVTKLRGVQALSESLTPDDSISSPMPDKKDEHTLYYI